MKYNSFALFFRKISLKEFQAPVLRLMTLTLLLVLFFNTTHAQTDNNITLKFKHAPLSKVLKTIKNQTGYVFVTGQIDLANIFVDADFKKADIRTVLSSCLPKVSLQYFIYDKTIVITRGTTDPAKLKNLSGSDELSGTIVGEAGETLPGATVVIVGLQRVVLTNNHGYFTMAGVPPNATVRISYTGFITEELSVPITRNLGTVTLKVNNNKLDEVHVLGYGQTTSERYSTGSSAKVTTSDIANQPVTNVLQALEGRVAGLTIRQTSGLPGSDIDVQIRGQSSINTNANVINSTNVIKNVPLFVVDGVPFPAAAINQQSSNADKNGTYNYLVGPNGNGSPLATINPNDIESIEVLKDASATGIYGSRGANGVILITTKKGKPGKANMSASVNTGYSYVPSSLSVLNLTDYLALRKEAFVNDSRTPTAGNAPDLTQWSQTTPTDFKSLLLGKPSHTVSSNLSFSGGSGGTTFIISGSYGRQSSIFDDDRSSSNYGVHFGLTYASDDQRFKTSVSALIGNATGNLANVDFYRTIFTLPPNFPLYNAAGQLYWYNGIPGIANPLSQLNMSYQNAMTNISTSVNLQYSILPGLDAQVNLGYNKTQSNQNSLQPSTSFDPSQLAYATPSASYTESYNQNLLVEPQLNYHRTVGKGALTAFVGGTLQKTVYEQPFLISASGFPSDQFLNNLSLATNYQIFNGYNAYSYASLLGRVNYIWDKRIVLDANFRRDGSSKFGTNNLYGNFGSVSGAWIFTNESWLKNKPDWFSFGKLRASYGSIGSDGVSNYSYLSTYSSNVNNYYSGANGLSPVRLANPDFKWETTHKTDVGLDIGLFQDKVLLSAVYYRGVTSNQLLPTPLPTQTGFDSYVQNFDATVENSGWEFTLVSNNIKSANFSWSSTFNAGFASNKLLSYAGLDKSIFASAYVVGKPLSALYLLHYTGIGANGLPTYEDVDKDGVITTSQGYNTGIGDLLYAGKSTPDLSGGLGNAFRYKGLQLNVFFQYTVGAVDQGILSYLSAPPGGLSNVPEAIVSQMRSLGLSKLFSSRSYSSNFNNFRQSDALLSKISYARLTNLSLSYNLPAQVTKKLGAGAINVYLRGQNLFVFTLSGKSYPGIDPETGPVAVPPLRAFVGGLQFSF
ncbi:TonB-dependent receptor plug [Mucilaginibacter paludis DSM 18603]|uniref:TonB-dependent receptor plug n=2 Tax=Mucilaginibacter TaxID=423349 RepID=H1YBP3_9SPHI|nr:TonB-dependent receptor plug [Mucilaginibacter paludis DSM 18603]